MSALRCTFTGRSVTVASVSMMFEEDRPLQLSVQPRDLGTFAAVCEVLNRHAGRLDRLDYADCVADLLSHVGEVRLECETTGLVPTVARMAGGAVHYEPAPPPAWPPPERQRSELNQRRGAGDTTLLPWERAQHKQFPRLLAKDRRRSLSARLAYYEAQGAAAAGRGLRAHDRRRPPRGLAARRRQQGGVRVFDRARLPARPSRDPAGQPDARDERRDVARAGADRERDRRRDDRRRQAGAGRSLRRGRRHRGADGSQGVHAGPRGASRSRVS